MKKTYYYQTFIGLDKLLSHVEDVDSIIISSIHFDKNKQGKQNIYLNDNLPSDPKFDTMWMETKEIYEDLLLKAGYGSIVTEIKKTPEFFLAEDYHQQYLAKNPNGYCGLGGTGIGLKKKLETSLEAC